MATAASLAATAALSTEVLALFKKYPNALLQPNDVARFFPDNSLREVQQCISYLLQAKSILQAKPNFYQYAGPR